MYSISELANMFDVSPRTIRYYEEVGLLASEVRDTPNHQRYYTNEERQRLKLILRGKRLGFSLQEIKQMVDMYQSNPSGEVERTRILQFADAKLLEIEEKMRYLQILKEDILLHRDRFLAEKKE